MSEPTQDEYKQHTLFQKYVSDSEFAPMQQEALNKFNAMTPNAFFDVSSDVYDEIKRRTSRSRDRYLPPRDDLPSKRNLGRQKLSTFPDSKFKEFVYQLLKELERRFPDVVRGRSTNSTSRNRETLSKRGSSKRRPSQDTSSYQSANSRAKSRAYGEQELNQEYQNMRNLDGDRSSSKYGSVRNRPDIQDAKSEPGRRTLTRMNDTDDRYRPRSRATGRSKSRDKSDPKEIDSIRSEYELKMAVLQKQIKRRDEEAEAFKSTISNLEKERDEAEKDLNDVNNKYSNLKLDFEDLSDRLESLSRDYENERREKEDLIKKYSKIDQDLEKQREIAKEANRLKVEAQDVAYEIEQKNIRLKMDLDDALAKLSQPQESGKAPLSPETSELENIVVKSKDTQEKKKKYFSIAPDVQTNSSVEINYAKYQSLTQELLDVIAQGSKASIISPLKQVLLVCQDITKDCEKKENDQSVSEDDLDAIFDAKSKLSKSLGQLMSVTREHTSLGGPQTGKKLEKQLSQLTFSVTNLVLVLRSIKSTDNNTILKRGASRKSIYSIKEKDQLLEPPPMQLNELLPYLESQLDTASQTQKDLFNAFKKASSKGEEFSDFLIILFNNADNIIYETEGTLDISKSMDQATVQDCEAILDALIEIRAELLEQSDLILANHKDFNLKEKIKDSIYDFLKNAEDLIQVLS